MLYTNMAFAVTKRALKENPEIEISGISVGERGRGRHEVRLATPKGLEGNLCGLYEDLTIGTSKSGRPRINPSNDKELYLILSSQRGYTRRGSGFVTAPRAQEVEVIARGNGADGDAGRIGTWDAVIVKVKDNDVFRIIWGGSGYGYEPTFYVVSDGQVYTANQPEIEDLYESLGMEIPFSLSFENDRLVINKDEWRWI